MIREISLKKLARDKVKVGIDKTVNVIKVTFGGCGRNVLIEKTGAYPVSTKDGVTVANSIELPDNMENMGALLVREVARKTVDVSGDGTTLASVLVQKIIELGLIAVDGGANPVALKKGIDKAIVAVVAKIKELSTPADTDDILKQIATVSANNDSEIGELIAKAISKVGRDGIIEVEESKTNDTTIEMVEGMQIDKGYISPYFINNEKKGKCELENPFILLYSKKLTSNKDLGPLMQEVAKTGRPVLIICEDLSEDVLKMLLMNKVSGFGVCAIKHPGFGGSKTLVMEDIAVLTNGKYIAEEKGVSLKNVKITDLGSAAKVIISKDRTTIVDGAGGTSLVEERCIQIQTEMVDVDTTEFEIGKMKERLAKLKNGVAVIKIGGATDIEVSEKRDRIDDSMCATRAAMDEGVVAGGGTTLLKCIYTLDKLIVSDNDESTGVKIISEAIKEPFAQILSNAGLPVPDMSTEEYGIGINVNTGEKINLLDAGIIDPSKVLRVSLENAGSAASEFIKTEGVISNIQPI